MNQDSCKISILVPIYNVEKYLAQCLESIIHQSYKELEIICINDGSTDSSLQIIEEYHHKDVRIKVITKPNTGYGNSMNIGLDVASGEYIGIVESDDFIEPDMFEKLYSLAKKDDLDISRSEFFYYENSTGVNTKSNNSYVPHNVVIKPADEHSVFYQQPSIWANLYKTSFLRNNKIRFLETPGASYQDTAFSFKVYSMADRFEMISDAFYHYRVNAGSSSFQGTTKVFCVVDEYDEVKRYIRGNGSWEKYHQLVAHLEYNGYLWNYNRLIEPYRSEFVEKWQQIINDEIQDGSISSDMFSSSELARVNAILSKGSLEVTPIVSIIVPVYNTEQYLRKCLDSLINQTFWDIEILCVNDGTKDHSQIIIDEYCKRDNRVISFIKKNGGLSSARNYGLKKARGKYIAFVDSDDWVEPSTYLNAVKNISGVDAVIFGTNVVGDGMLDRRESDLKYYSVNYNGIISLSNTVLFNTHVSAWNKLYRMDIIKANLLDFPEGLLYEDYSFFWKYFSQCQSVFFDPTPYYNYLRREGSIMDVTFKNGNTRAIEHLSIFEGIIEYYLNNKTKRTLSESDLNNLFLNCFWFAYLNVPLKSKKKVLHYGTKLVTKYKLKGHNDIDALAVRDYSKVDNRKVWTLKFRVCSKILKSFSESIGLDISPLIKSAYNESVSLEDCSNSLVSTEWIQKYHQVFNIARWKVIYDQNQTDSILNWGFTKGISGVVEVTPLKQWIKLGTKLSFYITLWGSECCILSAEVVYEGRFMTGTSMFDGNTFFSINVDWDGNSNKLAVRAVDPILHHDYSADCRIYRVEVSR